MKYRLMCALFLTVANDAQAASPREWGTFAQNLGASLPVDVNFVEASGGTEPLLAPDNRLPVVLTLGYYECPRLCSLVMNGLIEAVRRSGLKPGVDFKAVSLSIDPAESQVLARAKQESYLAKLGLGATTRDWKFYTGEAASIARVATAVGFRYGKDPVSGEWIHPSGLVILTPAGKISRYLPGVRFSPEELRVSLRNASTGRLGQLAQELWLACTGHAPVADRTEKILDGLRIFSLACLVLAALAGFTFLRRRRAWL